MVTKKKIEPRTRTEEIVVKNYIKPRKCPDEFCIIIECKYLKHKAKMQVKPSAPTTVVQDVLRSTLEVLDKYYPQPKPEKENPFLI